VESICGGHVDSLGEGELGGEMASGNLGFEERFGLGEGAQDNVDVMI
jgi:hypothetical protein